jgi:ferrochelatase
MTKEPWLGPDAGEVLDDLARGGAPGVVIAPIGFVCEHVEILYDVDVELRSRAEGHGLRLERIRMVNDAPATMAGLADLVREVVREAGWT